MAAPLKATSRYLNRYEEAYDRYSVTSPFFNESDWRKLTFSSNSEDLDMYIHALSKSKDIDKIKFDQEYMTKGEDDETRILALYNEVFGDRETLRDVEEYVYDESGNVVLDKNGNPKTTTIQMSNYDYTKKTIYETNKRNYEATLQEFEKESKGNLVADGAALVGEFLAGADVALTSMAEFAVTVADVSFDALSALFGAGVYNYSTNQMSKSYSEGWNAVADNWNYFWTDPSKGTFLQIPTELENGKASRTLRDAMTEFEINYTHFRDENGNLTTAGRYFVGAATTAGEMMASVLVGGSLSNLGRLSSKVSSIVNSTVYYAPMAARSLGETYQQFVDQGVSVSSASIICNQFIKTAVEVGIEFALGKIFGPTGLDKWLFGRDGAKSFKAKNFAQILGGHALDALQEGTEEVLQELSGIGIDNLFSAVLNESAFDEISELTWQTISDAFVIGALVSAGHAAVSTTIGVASTPATMTLNEDGTTSYSGKIANYVKGYNMATFSEFYNESQKKISDALNRQGQLLPSEGRLSELQRQRENLVRQIESIQNENVQNNTSQTVINSAVSGILSEQGITDFNSADIKKFELQALAKKVQDLDVEIAQTRASLTSESNANENVNKEIEALRSQYIEGFRGMYAAARMLQSFTSQLSEERFNAANDLLTKATEYLKSGKAEAPVLEQMYNEFIQTIQLSGVEVTVSLKESIKRSKITKFVRKFTRKDVDSEIKSDDYDAEDSDDYRTVVNLQRKVCKEILDGAKKVENVVIAGDGERIASDETTIIIPEKELSLGSSVVFNDAAEQLVVQNVLKGNYKGAVVQKVLDVYRRIYNNPDATEIDAVYTLLFDDSFFVTMLSGNMYVDNGHSVDLADTDMYQFLSSLYYAYDSYVPEDVLTATYKKKIDTVRKRMTSALISYLKLQPYADYRLDFLSDSEKTEIRKYSEAISVANRLIKGKGTKSDISFITDKVNALSLSDSEKTDLLTALQSDIPSDIQLALAQIDESYRISFYGSYDGNTYMPLVNLGNRVFNHFLYEKGIFISTLDSIRPYDIDISEHIDLLNKSLQAFSNGKYGLERASGKIDANSGGFYYGRIPVQIIDLSKPLTYKLISRAGMSSIRSIKPSQKVTSVRASKYTSLVKSVLKDSELSYYYTIDDVVTNPSLLSDDIQKEVVKQYGYLNAETAYSYLKNYFVKSNDNIALDLTNSGEVVFVDTVSTKKLFKSDIPVTKSGLNGKRISDFVTISEAVPFLKDCTIRIVNDIDSSFEVTTLRRNVRGIINISNRVLGNKSELMSHLAHEIQHAIQYSNKLNGGTTGTLLNFLSQADQDKLISEIRTKIPELLKSVDEDSISDVVNDFLYYGTGETSAYGATKNKVFSYYPIVVKDNGNGTVTISLPWGTSYTTEPQYKVQQKFTDRDSELQYLLSIGDSSIDNVKRLFYEFVKNEEVKQLGDKVFSVYADRISALFGNDLRIQMTTAEDVKERAGKSRAMAGAFVDTESDLGIYYNSEYFQELFTEGKTDRIAKTLLHEVIHAVTARTIRDLKRTLGSDLELYISYNVSSPKILSLSTEQQGALALIKLQRELYSKAKGKDLFIYGLSNELEFVAELSNPDFRNYLKNQTLWDKVINAIKKILGIESRDALHVSDKALEQVLNSTPKNLADFYGTSSYADVIESDKHLKSKGNTPRSRVPKKSTKGTPLEAFGGKVISRPLQEFIMSTSSDSYRNINSTIKKKIKDGSLTTSDLMEFLRTASSDNESDNVTFDLLNKTIFHNKHISSLAELDEYVITKTSNYYAMRVMFREAGQMEKLTDTESPELYDIFLDAMQNNSSLNSKFKKIADRYWSGPVINEGNLRRLWMQWFDGSVESAGYVAAVARVAAYQNWKITGGEKSSIISLGTSVGKGKDKKSTLTLENVVPDSSDFEDFNRFVNNDRVNRLISAMDRELVLQLVAEKQAGSNITFSDVETRRKELAEEIYNLSETDSKKFAELYSEHVADDEELANALYLQRLAKEASGKSEITIEEALENYEAAPDQAKGIVRPKKYVLANIKSISRTIRANLSAKEKKLFLKENGDLFDDNLLIKKSSYQNVSDNGVVRLKDESILLEIEERVRQLSKDVRNGKFSDEKFLSYRKAMERRIARLEKELLKATKNRVDKTITFTLVGEEIYVDTDKPLPRAIQRLLETELTKSAKSTTQLLTNDTDAHMVMNYKTFIDNNAELLNNLTQTDVNEIVDFYLTSNIIESTNRAKLYATVQQLLLGYILKMDGKPSSMFSLTNEQVDAIESRLELMVSTGSTITSTWKSVLKELRPEETVIKSMLKSCNIELDSSDEAELVNAISSGDVSRISAVKTRIYNNAVQKYRKRKRTIFERLLRFERMAMLSGPGTWVRNQVSNTLVEGGNKLSELITSILPTHKKSKKLKQYKLVGTKIDAKYRTWIKSSLVENGLLDLIYDGLIKYDVRRSSRVTLENQLTKLIINKIESDLFNTASAANSPGQFVQQLVFTMMSDKRSINKSFLRYLGKMLTEDDTDISKGLTTEVMDTIAEAYTAAAQDYMHSHNFWNKIEESLRVYLHKRFSPTVADGIYFMYKQVLPFASASWNWFMEGLNYTPVGLAKGIVQLCRLENTVNTMEEARRKGEAVRSSRFAEYIAKRNIGKGVIGSVTLLIGVLLVASGKAGYDEEDKEYKLIVNSSDSPIYIDISDVFGTTGLIVGMSIAQGVKDANGQFDYSTFMKIMTSSFNTMFVDSTISNLYNTFQYSTSLGDYLAGLPMDVAGMFVPNFVKTVGNVAKKYNVNYSSGVLGQFERFVVQSFGAFSYLLPYKVNPYTGDAEVLNEGWFGVNVVNKFTPIKISNRNFSDEEFEAVSLGVRKSQLTGKYTVGDESIALSGSDRESLNMFYGKLNKTDLHKLMSDEILYTVEDSKGKRVELKYSKMNDEQKKAVIERIMLNNSQIAKIYILTSKYGYKYYASDSEYERLKKLGINNVYRKTNKVEGFVKNN